MIGEKVQGAQSGEYAFADEMYRALFDQAADGIFISDMEGRYVEVNPRGCAMLGYTRQEILGMSLQELLAPADLAQDPPKLDEIKRGQVPLRQRTLRCKDGQWLPVEIKGQMLEGGYLLGIVRDISERAHLEEQQRILAAHTAALARASQAFSEVTTDYEHLMDTIVRTVVELMGDWSSIRLLSEDGEWLHPGTYHGVGAEAQSFSRRSLAEASYYVPQEPLLQNIVEKMETLFLPWVDMHQFAKIASEQHQSLLEALPLHSLIMAPLRVQGSVIGMLQIARYQPEQSPFTEDDKRLAQDLADRAALAIRNATLYRDMQAELKQRQEAERLLREEQTRFQQVVATSPGVIHTFKQGPNGTNSFPYASPRIKEIYGMDAETLKSDASNVLSLSPEEDQQQIRADIANALRTMSMWHTEFRVNHPEKGEIWVEGRSMPKREPDGSVLWHGFLTDITDRKRAEIARLQDEYRMQAVLENLAEGLVISDLEGNITYCNRAALEMHDFASMEECFKTQPEFRNIYEVSTLDGDVVPYEDWPMQRLYRGEEVHNLELRLRRLDIEWERIIRYGGSSVIDQSGKPVVFLTHLDITQRKQMEMRLRESESRFRRMANAAPAVLSITDTDNAVTFLSRSWYEFTGQTEAEALGVGWLDAVHPDDRERSLAALADAVEQRAPFAIDYRLRRHDGEYHWTIGAGRPFVAADGSWQGYVSSVIDIHARKLAEQQVHQLNSELEQRVEQRTAQLAAANKELEAFAYSVSHDLRAPLRAINGYARILLEDYHATLDADGQRLLNIVSRQAQHMGTLIDDLLTLSRLNRAEMNFSTIDMGALVPSLFSESTTPEERERTDFCVQDLPPSQGDPTLLRQVWLNLLTNAVKFSSKRERSIIQVGSTPAEGETIYWVRDNGAGFDMRYAHKLFGIFQRLHSEREFQGTGVGLAIVQRVVARHEGRVWAKGQVDQGATFYFALPNR